MRLSEMVAVDMGALRIPAALFPRPFRFALFQKRRDTLPEIRGGTGLRVLRDGIGELPVEVFTDESVDEGFSGSHRSRAIFLQRRGEFACARYELRGVHHFIHQAK